MGGWGLDLGGRALRSGVGLRPSTAAFAGSSGAASAAGLSVGFAVRGLCLKVPAVNPEGAGGVGGRCWVLGLGKTARFSVRNRVTVS